MSKCHFLSSYCVVSKVRHRIGATRRGQFGRPKSGNTVYMREPSSLRYNRAEHEEIHFTCGSHIACFGIQIRSSFTTSTVFEMPAWTLNVLLIHLFIFNTRVLGLWTSNHLDRWHLTTIIQTWAASYVGFCSGYTWSIWISSSTCWQKGVVTRASEPLTIAMAYHDPSFSSVNS